MSLIGVELWSVAVKYPQAGAFNIMVSDSGDGSGEPSAKKMLFLGSRQERDRCSDKAIRAYTIALRALRRKNLRRARYWNNVGSRWWGRYTRFVSLP